MKKTLVSLSLCALVAFGATSCKKDVEQNGEYQFRATVENCSDAKTTYNGTAIQWNANDTVMIYGLVPGRYVATPEEGNPGAAKLRRLGAPVTYMGDEVTAIYPAALANSASNITLPALQETEDGNLMSNFPMIATSTDENLYFKNLCGALKVHLEQENVSIYKIEVTAETAINGTFDIDNTGDDPVLTNGTEGTTTTTLICTTPQDITGGHDFFVTMPAGNYQNLQVTIYRYDNAKRVKTAPAGATITITRSRYFTLNIVTDFAPDPCVDCLITVNDNGKQVCFSKGNLLHDGTNFSFAEHQYDYYWSTTPNPYRDRFYWSVEGNNYGLTNPGSAEDVANLAYVDFGQTLNPNYGDEPWYVLSDEEFGYAVNAGNSHNVRWHRSTRATLNINGTTVEGRVLFPDNWDERCPEDINIVYVAGTEPYANYSMNNFNADQWAELEAAGAVFLPYGGNYWTSTRVPTNASQAFSWIRANSHWSTSYSSIGGNSATQVMVRLVQTFVPSSIQ